MGVGCILGPTGSGEKHVKGDVRGGGRLSGQIRIGVSAWQISDNGRGGIPKDALSIGLGGSVVLLTKFGFILCMAGGHTDVGEKHVSRDVRSGGKLGSDGPAEDPEERWTEVGLCDANRDVVLEVRFVGSVALLPSSGLDTDNRGTHEGAGELRVKDEVRDAASLGTEVAAVEGRDEATLTIDDRLDAAVEMSDGQMIGDGAPSDRSSTVAMLVAFDGNVLNRLKSGFGINSVSSWKKSSGKGGRGLSNPHERRYGLRSGIGGVELNVMSVSSEAEAIPSTRLYSKMELLAQGVATALINQGTKQWTGRW